MRRAWIAWAAASWAVISMALMAHMAASEESSDEILLRLDNDAELFELDRAALEALPQTRFETETIWTEGKVAFSGPTLMSVLELAGLSGQPVEATAVNAYKSTIPAEFIEKDVPIIATRMNGEAFGRRRNGPLWIVFPYDSERRFQRELIFSMSVWQLVRLQLADG